jgi:hypothetical protein
LHVVKSMPEAAQAHEIAIGGRPAVSLSAMIVDYLRHVDNHLGQIFGPA